MGGKQGEEKEKMMQRRTDYEVGRRERGENFEVE
jgi:hypothetical protein